LLRTNLMAAATENYLKTKKGTKKKWEGTTIPSWWGEEEECTLKKYALSKGVERQDCGHVWWKNRKFPGKESLRSKTKEEISGKKKAWGGGVKKKKKNARQPGKVSVLGGKNHEKGTVGPGQGVFWLRKGAAQQCPHLTNIGGRPKAGATNEMQRGPKRSYR